MINIGDVVYFKKVTREIKRRSQEIGFKGGHGFGVMLGIVPPFQKEPAEGTLLQLMGQVGFMSFDDVKEFIGEDQMKVCVEKFKVKYYKPKSNLILSGKPPEHDEVTQKLQDAHDRANGFEPEDKNLQGDCS